MKVTPCPVPEDALLHAYVTRDGAYTDCFEITHVAEVDLPAFVTAFYTTWLFRLERAVLGLALRKRIRDSDVALLAQGRSDAFAAWRVEARGAREILLCDITGATRSYLAVAAQGDGTTRLLFGSAVVGRGSGEVPWLIRLTTPLHQLYSRALLRLAAGKLEVAPASA
jgi:hypothetical protein